MDGFRFDALTRTLATAPSRRRVLTGLIEESQCRTPCNCCDCFGHGSGQPVACAENFSAMTCDEHADCALGSVCLGGPPGLCTLPCPG